MKTIRIFDDRNYDVSWKKVYREAARAVIIKDKKIAMVKSLKEGFYKFPGGGIEKGENRHDALIREAIEETGLNVIPSTIKEIGMIHEIRKGIYGDEIFDQKSYYYYAEIFDGQSDQMLDEYEKELEYVLEWVDIASAHSVNMELGKSYETSFILREAYMLEYLLHTQNCK